MRSYLAARSELLASAEPGLDAARHLSALTDEAVRDLARAASSQVRGRVAIVALGGWGAGAMLPSSDLDILVLSDLPASKLKPYVEAVLYPLWDAGLSVGHQVRTPREQLAAMREDFVTCTAALTARVLAGDTSWAERELFGFAGDAHKRARRLLAELAARPRPGSPYLLEPDLKDGAGGRRDYDELVWTSTVLTGAIQHEPSALVGADILTAREFATLAASARTIASARWALSLAGTGNVLALDALEALPPGLADAAQLALAETALVLVNARQRLGGRIVDPDAPLSAEAVLALLDGGEGALEPLEHAAQSGRLEALAPGYRDLMTLRRPGLGHELTVGAHSLRAAAMVLSPPENDGPLARSLAALAHPRVVQVAAFAHDVGKTGSGANHAEVGAGPAEEIARRFGLEHDAARDVGDLVRLHLALAELATRTDLDDEEAVLSAAARIGRRELLAPLHLLTAADSLATGPATWSSWRGVLLGALVSRLDAALSDDVDGAGLVAAGEAVRAATSSALEHASDAERAFVRLAPLRYLASRQPAEVARDARLVASLSAAGGADDARVAVSPGPTEGAHVLTVIAHDRPELLARVAGAIALAGLDILSVDAYGAPGGIAIDSFAVASATLRPVTTETFTGFERLLGAALRDRLELRTRLLERRKHYPTRGRAPVRVKTVAAGYDTAVRVSAPDRPGLLHDLAQAVSATGLNIRWAKVLTVDGTAIDTFHVVDADGNVPDDGVVGHLAMRLREIG